MPMTEKDKDARIAELEAEVDRLQELVMFDPLTGLFTRRHLTAHMASVTSDANRHKLPDLFLLFIDLDNFGQINTDHGHPGGDRVLQGFGLIVKETIRTNDVAGRWGGEEFLVVGRGDGDRLAERLRQAVAKEPIAEIRATISIGVAVYQINEEVNDWLRRANEALYLSKRSGRNRVSTAPRP